MKNKEFNLGDFVSWTSQSRGRKTEKSGEIVHVLKKENVQNTTAGRIASILFPEYKWMFTGEKIPGNAEVGYFVKVITGPRALPKLYMPYPSKLKRVK